MPVNDKVPVNNEDTHRQEPPARSDGPNKGSGSDGIVVVGSPRREFKERQNEENFDDREASRFSRNDKKDANNARELRVTQGFAGASERTCQENFDSAKDAIDRQAILDGRDRSIEAIACAAGVSGVAMGIGAFSKLAGRIAAGIGAAACGTYSAVRTATTELNRLDQASEARKEFRDCEQSHRISTCSETGTVRIGQE